jgi:hypothetical protein
MEYLWHTLDLMQGSQAAFSLAQELGEGEPAPDIARQIPEEAGSTEMKGRPAGQPQLLGVRPERGSRQAFLVE